MTAYRLLRESTSVVFTHAHPDDEVLVTGALIADLVERSVEVAVLTATRGERGGSVDAPGMPLPGTDEYVTLRESELAGSLDTLGVTRRAFLGEGTARAASRQQRRYEDSGMVWVTQTVAGPSGDAGEAAFSLASVDEASADVAAYLTDRGADVVVSYDATGGYGHPDHVHMHEVTRVAAQLAGIPMVEVLPANSDHPDAIDLSGRREQVVAALKHHRSQLVVSGDEVIHHGGQRQPIDLHARLAVVEPDS